jgi:hypothetical protein
MKVYRGVDVSTHVFLTTTLIGDECSASRSYRFTPGKVISVLIGRDGEVKIFLPYRDPNSDPSVVQPVASRYTDFATAAHRAGRCLNQDA